MAPVADPIGEYPAPSVVAGTCAFLVVAAWFTAHAGVSVALAYYGAMLVSECLHHRSKTNHTGRALSLLGQVLTWLAVLAFSALVLPSNFSTAVI
jgi:hypothetical protein